MGVVYEPDVDEAVVGAGACLLPPVTVAYVGREVEVRSWVGDDGAIVVQVDTSPTSGHVRVNLNDAVLFDADPDVGVRR